MRSYPRIIFFGSPSFAVYSLRRIIEKGYNVVSVVTVPDKPAGRGLGIKISPVKEAALELGIPVIQPANLREPLFLEQLATLRPDLQIIIAFRMLPRSVWEIPPLGTINLHASLLPQYRGAAPINWVIMNGEKATGLTTFFLNDRIDSGKIIYRMPLSIGPEENAGELHDRLMVSGAELILKTVEDIIQNSAPRVDQTDLSGHDIVLKSAPKLTREHCRIDWNQDITFIHDKIRGLAPHPGAFTELPMMDGRLLFVKVFRSSITHSDDIRNAGTILTDGKTFFNVTGRNGLVQILELQPAGRKPLKIDNFLNGFGKMFIRNP